MNRKNIVWIIAFILLASLAFALEIKSGTSEDLTIFLRNSTSGAPAEGASCYLDIWNPNSAKIIDDGAMTELGEGFYYYTTQTGANWSIVGNYRVLAKCVYGAKTYYSATMYSVVETTVTEWFTAINTTVANTYDYLQNTIYPAVDTLESSLSDALSNQTNLWNKLVDIQGNVTENYNEILNSQSQLNDINASVMNELNDHRNRLIAINTTVSLVLGNISQEVLPKISQLQTDVDLIKAYTDSLESGQSSILGNISDIQSAVDVINSKTDAVAGYVDTLEDVLNCNGTIDTPVCSKLDTIGSTIDAINENTDSLESGQTSIISYVDTLESGQSDIISNINDMKSYLNCSTKIMDSVCWRLDLLQNYTDTLESGQLAIEAYVDTLEINQTAMLSLLDSINANTDSLEAGIADLNSTLQNMNTSFESRFDLIDSYLADIYSDTQSMLADGVNLDNATSAALYNILVLTQQANATSLWVKDYLNGTITDYLFDINQTVSVINVTVTGINATVANIHAYLQSTVYPAVDALEGKLSDALANQTNMWNKLVEIQDNVADNYNEIINTQQQLADANASIMAELDEHKSRLAEINTTTHIILWNITQAINPKLDSAISNLDLIKDYTDTLESGQSAIIGNVDAVEEGITNLASDMQNLGSVMNARFDVIQGNLTEISNNVQDMITNGVGLDWITNQTLYSILDLTQQANATSLWVKDYLNGTITDYLFEINYAVEDINETVAAINETVAEVNETVFNISLTLYNVSETVSEINATVSQINETVVDINQTAAMILANITQIISPKLDALQSDIDLIEAYTDALEPGQNDMLSNLTSVLGYTANIEQGIASISSNLNEMNISNNEIFESIVGNISSIYSDTQSILTSGVSLDGITNQTLYTILGLAENANATAYWVQGYLNGTVTGYLIDINQTAAHINQTLTYAYNLLLALNLTIGQIYTDTQNILGKWGSYDAQYISDKLDAMHTDINSIDRANNTEVLAAIQKLETILNATRDELDFTGKNISAYEYFVRLENLLYNVNATLFNKIEFEHNLTRDEVLAAIEGNQTLLYNQLLNNSNKLDFLLNKWGTVTASQLLSNTTETRNTLTDIENWLNAFNETEFERYNSSYTYMGGLFDWFVLLNETEHQRHSSLQADIDNVYLLLGETNELVINITSRIGYYGISETLYDDIQKLIEIAANITFDVGDLNVSVSPIDYVILHEGKNLFALPTEPSNTSIEFVLAPIDGSYYRVDYYNQTSGEFKTYNPDAPFGNTLTELTTGRVYWIWMYEEDILFIG